MTAVAERQRPWAPRRAAAAAGDDAGRRLGWAALGALLALGFAVLVYAGRRTGFYFDEWNFVELRRGWSADALLDPHNEHLSLLPVLVYKLLFELVGIDSYVPYRVAGLVVHLLVVALLFAYARRRVGDLLALGAAVTMLFLGPAWADILWPFQIGFLGSLAAGLGTLLALDRRDRRGDLLAALLLAVALACSSLGVPLLIAAAVEVGGRSDRARRWPLVAAPLALYALWYSTYRSKGGDASGGITADNLFEAPAYVAQAAAGALGALVGLDADWGRILVVAAVLGLVGLTLRPVPGLFSWRLAALAVAPLAFWALTAASRANLNEPNASRYLYPGALFLLLIAIELARGRRANQRLLALGAVLLAGATVANVDALRKGAGYLRDQTAIVQGALAATELAGPRLPPGFQPAPKEAPQIAAAAYLDSVRELGSPTYPAGELASARSTARAAADDALVRALALAPTSAPSARESGPAPVLEQAEAATARTDGSCLVAAPQNGSGAALTVTVPPGGLVVTPRRAGPGQIGVQVRRWADSPVTLPPAPANAASVVVRIPPDGAAAPWHARIELPAAVRVCGAPK